MPRIYIDGRPIDAKPGQTVKQAAVDAGIEIPAFCWHPKLSVSGSCRVCAVQVEGRSWVEISCNMPVSEDLKVLTDTDVVRAYRKSILELTTLNHPVDCGICDKSGECLLQDYHYEHNGAPSNSRDVKVHATKFHHLSDRVTLDNERCILCSRCVRFTHEISKSKSLGIVHRGDSSLIRASEDGAFERDAYSENVVDICPVGALLSRSFLYKSRVWYLQPTASVCPGCARGCSVNLWHRKSEWALRALDPRKNVAVERVTPRENPAINGPWVCNKARDLPAFFARPRATTALVAGVPVETAVAVEAARRLVAGARHALAFISNWGSNEELDAFARTLGARFSARVKRDCAAAHDEVVEDAFLIRADKNPNTAGAQARFAGNDDGAPPLPEGVELVLAWGEGFDFSRVPPGARVIALDAWHKRAHASVDVFIPLSAQTERAGSYTNFEGTVNAFEPCFPKPEAAMHAADLFVALAVRENVPA
jgi:NADH-quinone oxidoreductase subunit G